MSDLKKALQVLLYDQSDAVDLEVDSGDKTFISYIIAALIEKNGKTCPFKNYGSELHCKTFTEKCRHGLKIDCGSDSEKVWREFIGVKD